MSKDARITCRLGLHEVGLCLTACCGGAAEGSGPLGAHGCAHRRLPPPAQQARAARAEGQAGRRHGPRARDAARARLRRGCRVSLDTFVQTLASASCRRRRSTRQTLPRVTHPCRGRPPCHKCRCHSVCTKVLLAEALSRQKVSKLEKSLDLWS